MFTQANVELKILYGCMNIYIYIYIKNKIYRNKQQSHHCVCYSLCTYLVRCQGRQVFFVLIVHMTDLFIICFII